MNVSEIKDLELRVENYQKMESYCQAIGIIAVGHGDDNLYNFFKLILRDLSFIELARVMPVCRTFFIIGRELITQKIPAQITEREGVEKQLKETLWEPGLFGMCLSIESYMHFNRF